MNLKGKIITLENDKEYFVQEELTLDGKNYIYAMEMTNPQNINFYLVENESAVAADNELAKKLLVKLAEKLKVSTDS